MSGISCHCSSNTMACGRSGSKNGFRRSDERLHEAAVEAAHRRAEGAVDLDLKKVVALDAVSPRRADLSQNTARELENRKGGVLDIDTVAFAALVATPRDRGRVAARHRFDLAQQAVEDVAPMGEHIQDEAAARRLAIVPARPLRRIELPVEHPPAEIEPDRQHAAEEIAVVSFLSLRSPGRNNLSCTTPPCGSCAA